ncbi:hypothetical protein PG5_52890 [Pseudomonas sp. G5(2012)]|nr:hypothetical protein PG5_52890 [Pseudomonas sp. G5(2012)]
MHSKQPCCSGEDASSVAKEIGRPTLYQIAECPEQTAIVAQPTNAATDLSVDDLKNRKKLGIFCPAPRSDFLSSSNK